MAKNIRQSSKPKAEVAPAASPRVDQDGAARVACRRRLLDLLGT